MQTFKDFCVWAGSQRKAAEKLGVNESTVSRACRGRPSILLAQRAERVSDGRFLAASMLGLIRSSFPQDQQAA